jgi:transcription antitermination factor NusG
MTSWFVLSARYGCQEAIKQAIEAAGCECWYPRQKVRVRAKLIELPLDRYVFVRAEWITAELWHVAGDVEGFGGWLGGEVPIALRPNEMEIFSGVVGGTLDEEATARLRRGWGEGSTVIVTKGHFVGQIGTVLGPASVKKRKNAFFVLLRGLLGGDQRLLYDASALEAIATRATDADSGAVKLANSRVPLKPKSKAKIPHGSHLRRQAKRRREISVKES